MHPSVANPFEASAIPLSSEDFDRIRALILDAAGISLAPGKLSMVYNRIAKRVRDLNMHGFGQYLDAVEADRGGERGIFVNALTTNITSFFRERHHFEALAERLPAWAKAGEVVIWSAGCSTGEEPYSIAMVAAETFDSPTPPVKIFASDISSHVIEHARAAEYSDTEVTGSGDVSEERVKRFFLRGTGKYRGRYKVIPELQRMVSFHRFSLFAGAWPVPEKLHAIFCRNVIIYFDRENQIRVLRRFAQRMLPDSALFAGHSESVQHLCGEFSTDGKGVLRVRLPLRGAA